MKDYGSYMKDDWKNDDKDSYNLIQKWRRNWESVIRVGKMKKG